MRRIPTFLKTLTRILFLITAAVTLLPWQQSALGERQGNAIVILEVGALLALASSYEYLRTNRLDMAGGSSLIGTAFIFAAIAIVAHPHLTAVRAENRVEDALQEVARCGGDPGAHCSSMKAELAARRIELEAARVRGRASEPFTGRFEFLLSVVAAFIALFAGTAQLIASHRRREFT